MLRLDGRAAIVTGAGMGLARGVARRLASEGARVLVADLRADAAEETAAGIEADGGIAAFAEFDAGVRSSVFAMVDDCVRRYGRVDVLISAAQAFTPVVPLEEKTDDMFELSLRTGLWGSLWGMQAVFPHMRQAGGGSIVNFASVFGTRGQAYYSDYNTAKEAIRGLTRSAASDWGQYGIRVNCIEPNGTGSSGDAVAGEVAQYIPMRRRGGAEADIGGVALFLASDDSVYVTGSTVYADGGTHISSPLIPTRSTVPDGRGHWIPGGS